MRQFNITVNGVAYSVAGEEVNGTAAPAPVAAPSAAPAASLAAGEPVKAPMPGVVLKVQVQQGQAVKAGQVLVILEAMKMENEIVAPKDGTVAQIVAAKGASVESGAPLVILA